jgi:hypothetical protein
MQYEQYESKGACNNVFLFLFKYLFICTLPHLRDFPKVNEWMSMSLCTCSTAKEVRRSCNIVVLKYVLRRLRTENDLSANYYVFWFLQQEFITFIILNYFVLPNFYYKYKKITLKTSGQYGNMNNGPDRRIELFVCDVEGVLQIRWFSGCQCCHLLISALNITMSQRKSVLYVSNITSTVSW